MQQRILTALQPYIKIASGVVAGWLASTHLGLHYGSDEVAKAITFIGATGLTIAGHVAHDAVQRLPKPLTTTLGTVLGGYRTGGLVSSGSIMSGAADTPPATPFPPASSAAPAQGSTGGASS